MTSSPAMVAPITKRQHQALAMAVSCPDWLADERLRLLHGVLLATLCRKRYVDLIDDRYTVTDFGRTALKFSPWKGTP